MADTDQPTAEDLSKAGEVSGAAAAAVQQTAEQGGSAEDARASARTAVAAKAKEVDFKLSDEDCNKLVDMLIDRLNALGAFDQPAAAPNPTVAPAPEVAAQAAADVAATEPPPRKLTFAEKHFGNA